MIDSASNSMLELQIESALSDRLLTEIERLSEQCEVPQINIAPNFLKTFEKCLLLNWEPLFLKVINSENSELIGIVPLMHQTLKRKGLIPYKVIKFFGSTFSDFHDIYSKKEHKSLVINRALDWMFDEYTWQELVLDDLLDSTNLITPILSYLEKEKLSYKHTEGKYFYIDLDRSWNEVKSDTSKSFVWKNVRLAKNRISKAGRWEILYDPNLAADEILSRLTPIHIDRQQALGQDSVFSDDNYREAYRDVMQNSLQSEKFQTFWLRFEDRDIGYMIGFYLNGVFYWWSTGFLDEYKSFYPSRLLLFYVLKYMHENKYKEFNFMRGESGYKDKWTKTTRKNHRIRVYNNKNLYGKAIGIFDKKFR